MCFIKNKNWKTLKNILCSKTKTIEVHGLRKYVVNEKKNCSDWSQQI